MRIADPPEPLKPGTKRRPLLLDLAGRTPNDHFALLTRSLNHRPALLALGEVYLAMPRPDDNFVPDFQTANFDARLWELYPLAAFREQGITVFQDVPSPDFRIEREGHAAYVEAVTANATGERAEAFSRPQAAPEDLRERLLGAPAERFAKTLRSKLQRDYHNLPHVSGGPFALALADFHAPSSMTWSRGAPKLSVRVLSSNHRWSRGATGRSHSGRPACRSPRASRRSVPRSGDGLPVRDHLQQCGYTGEVQSHGISGRVASTGPDDARREGILLDRTPGALTGVPFDLDILSDDYTALWQPYGEQWCVELEVYHNPLAAHPFAFDLLPGATHWFEVDGEIVCSTIWEQQVLSSITLLTRSSANG